MFFPNNFIKNYTLQIKVNTKYKNYIQKMEVEIKKGGERKKEKNHSL